MKCDWDVAHCLTIGTLNVAFLVLAFLSSPVSLRARIRALSARRGVTEFRYSKVRDRAQ